MVHSQAPPPLQAKPQATPTTASGASMAPPPPLQIKIVPAMLQAGGVVTTTTSLSGATTLLGDMGEMDQSAAMDTGGEEVEGEVGPDDVILSGRTGDYVFLSKVIFLSKYTEDVYFGVVEILYFLKSFLTFSFE